jgi:hypothetical protein
MAAIRWWAGKVNRQSAVARTNDFYGIGRRQLVGTESKAKDVPDEQLSRITDPFVRLSLELQRAFGLRREEAIKFRPSYGDHGDQLQLKASWTTGERNGACRSETRSSGKSWIAFGSWQGRTR